VNCWNCCSRTFAGQTALCCPTNNVKALYRNRRIHH